MNVRSTVKPLAVLLVLCFGIWWGGHPSQMPAFMRSVFVANPHDTVISEALSDIQHDYFHPISRGGLINGSITGAIASLDDPYAIYQTPATYSAFTNPKPQHFAGVGITVDATASGLVVESVLPGAPSARAGVHAGDLITAVGGRRLAGLPSNTSTELIRGRAGTKVTLAITRGSRHLKVTVTRATIQTPLVYENVVPYHGVKIGVLDLPTFDVPGIHGDVATALQSLLHSHVRALVLDLRDNPGGLVTEAQLVASMFIAHGKIVTTRGRVEPTDTLYATGHPLAPSLPMAVLVNGDTASAAEIVTGALQDHHRAVIVGTHTYGKGVFQEIRPLSNGGAINFTVGEYFLPNGRNLGAGGLKRGAGITPNVTVKAQPTATSDPQLQAALRLLAAKVR
ncbi:MAG TPA: S41 family peptidase [Solirubrobacteraceae bacterium]|jgi:carboxyl-terminal processing protease